MTDWQNLLPKWTSSNGIETLSNLVSIPHPPPFLFVHSPFNLRLATQFLIDYIQTTDKKYHPQHQEQQEHDSNYIAIQNALPCLIHIDAIEITSAKVLYDRVLNGLAGWNMGLNSQDSNVGPDTNWDGRLQGALVDSNNNNKIQWNSNSSTNTNSNSKLPKRGISSESRNESFDTFSRGLCDIFRIGQKENDEPSDNDNQQEEQQQKGRHQTTINRTRFIIIENPERLSGNHVGENVTTEGNILACFSRLKEITNLPFSVIFLSTQSWHKLQPPVPKFSDPGEIITLAPLTKADIINVLQKSLQSLNTSTSLSTNQFLELIYSQFSTIYGGSLQAYINVFNRLWPKWVELASRHRNPIAQFKSILIKETNKAGTVQTTVFLDHHHQQEKDKTEGEGMGHLESPSNLLSSPSKSINNSPSIFSPIRSPCKINLQSYSKSPQDVQESKIITLPLLSKWLLIAAFYASYNPVSSDVRLFATFNQEGISSPRKKKRRIQKVDENGNPKKQKESQLVLGPKTFQVERLLALCHCILPQDLADSFDEADLCVQIAALVHLRLLVKTSRNLKTGAMIDKLEGIRLKCNLDKDSADMIAKDIGFNLDERLWEEEDAYERA